MLEAANTAASSIFTDEYIEREDSVGLPSIPKSDEVLFFDNYFILKDGKAG